MILYINFVVNLLFNNTISVMKTRDTKIFQILFSPNKKTLIFLSFLLFTFFGFSQNRKNETELKVVKTTETGVNVYESGGVEGFRKEPANVPTPVREVKPISEWSMEECDNALYGVNLKITALENGGSPETDIEGYRKMKSEMMLRKEELINLSK